jgi:hypothetical protein
MPKHVHIYLKDANANGTISEGEDEDFKRLLRSLTQQMNQLVSKAKEECDNIGGQFRSPGYRKQVKAVFDSIVRTL